MTPLPPPNASSGTASQAAQRAAVARAESQLAAEKARVLATGTPRDWVETLTSEVLAGLAALMPTAAPDAIAEGVEAELRALAGETAVITHLERSALILRATRLLGATDALAAEWRAIDDGDPGATA